MLPTILASLACVLPADGPFEEATLSEALALAGERDKVVFVDFFTTWCGPCKKLDQVTWKDERVVAWLAEHTVAVKIDAEEDTQSSGRYEVQAFPSLVFLRPDGSEIDRLVGYLDPEAFLAKAGALLAARGRWKSCARRWRRSRTT